MSYSQIMNRFIAIALILISAATSAAKPPRARSTAASQPSTVYGVAFYNLENLFDTINTNGSYDLEFTPAGARKWDTEKYRAKISNLASAIAAMTCADTPSGPAVIGIAEVENRDVVADLVNSPEIARRNLGIVHHDSPDQRGIDVALLFNPELFTPLDVSTHTLSINSEPEFRTRDQLCVTGLLGDADTVSIIVNHWPSRLGGKNESEPRRIAAANLCRHIADSLWRRHPDRGIIIMGDLNDDPHDTSCAVTLGAGKRAENVRRHGFYNPWWKILDAGRGTLAYRGNWNLFDQIIVSGTLLPAHNSKLQLKRARINNFDFLRDDDGRTPRRTYRSGRWLNGYSDHFPTEIYLEKRRSIR